MRVCTCVYMGLCTCVRLCVCVCVCVCVFLKCYFVFVCGFRFHLCFYRDSFTVEIVQLMSEMDRINAETTQDPDFTSSDILIAGGVTWNKWLQILRQNYKEKMQNQKQNQQELMGQVQNTSGPMRRSQTVNRDTTLDHDKHSQRI